MSVASWWERCPVKENKLSKFIHGEDFIRTNLLISGKLFGADESCVNLEGTLQLNVWNILFYRPFRIIWYWSIQLQLVWVFCCSSSIPVMMQSNKYVTLGDPESAAKRMLGLLGYHCQVTRKNLILMFIMWPTGSHLQSVDLMISSLVGSRKDNIFYVIR